MEVVPTKLLVDLEDIANAISNVANSTAQKAVEIIEKGSDTKTSSFLDDWMSEQEMLNLLSTRDPVHLKKLCEKHNIPLAKFGKAKFYSKIAMNNYLNHSLIEVI